MAYDFQVVVDTGDPHPLAGWWVTLADPEGDEFCVS